jgi:hypothetical protein
MSTLTLLEAAAEYRHITDVLQDADVDEQTLKDTLEAEAWPVELKANNYCIVIGNLEASAEAIKHLEERLYRRRKAMESRVKFLRDRLRQAMEITGMKRIDAPQFSISVQLNPAAVDVFEPALLPNEYLRYPAPPPPEPNKAAIKEAIESGADVPGARLSRSTKLVIR